MVAAGLWAAAAADAHVTVNSPSATQGGYAVLTFRVPTESDTASTTELKVQLPGDHPLASVSVQPHPAWSFTAAKAKAIQTYSDGTVVSWIEVPAAGSSAEPEHPAPTSQLVAAGAADPAGTQSTTAARPTVTGSSAAKKDTPSSGAATTGIVLGAPGWSWAQRRWG